jgi:hypothetical protein
VAAVVYISKIAKETGEQFERKRRIQEDGMKE